MAKIVFSAVVGDARKKVGGVVFTKVRSGSIVRRKVSPIQPRSVAQMNVRANFTHLAKLWSDVTMLNYRAAWIALAGQYPRKDKFGAAHTLTGMQLFVGCNRALQRINLGPILPAPATLSVPYPGALSLSPVGAAPITGLMLDCAVWPTADETGVVYATPPMSPGRATAGAKFRSIAGINVTSAEPYDIYGPYVTKFGVPPTGRQIFFQVRFTAKATGAKSLPTEAAITV